MAQNNALNKSSEDFTVDNLFLDGNTLSSTDTNGNINLTPDGTGGVVVATDLTVGNTVQDTSFTINGAATKSVITLEATNSSSLDGFVTHRHSDTAGFGGHTVALRTRGSHATPTIVQDDDVLSINAVAGFDGTDYALAAQINVEVDGTPGSNDMPGRIVFKTSPDGTQTPTTALTITQDQGVTAAAYIDVDNLRLDGNTLSSTSGAVTIQPLATEDLNLTADNVLQTYTAAGSTVANIITNSDNTSTSSHAKLSLVAGGTSGGDAFINFNIPSGRQYSFGIDNSQAEDELQLTTAATPSGASQLLAINDPNMRMQFGYGINNIISRLQCVNSGTTDAGASVFASVGASATGDAFFTCEVQATRSYCYGIDNSDNDILKINTDAASDVNPSSGTNLWSMTTAGERTMPLQPAFLAYLATDDSNVTGNNTLVVLGAATALTEVYDQNADFNTNGTFTAPVTGKYHLDTVVTMVAASMASSTIYYIQFLTSNRTYQASHQESTSTEPTKDQKMAALVDMDAADTAQVRVAVSGIGADTADIDGSTTLITFFSGFLAC